MNGLRTVADLKTPTGRAICGPALFNELARKLSENINDEFGISACCRAAALNKKKSRRGGPK